MIDLTLAEVAAAVDGTVAPGDGDRRVTGVAIDSREVGHGTLFVALRGEHRDGHDFVAAASANGAVGYLARRAVDGAPGAVLVEDPRAALLALGGEVRRRVDPWVVAVTGSVGKTTTKDLAAAALRSSHRTVAAPASYNNEIGVPLTLLAIERDTEVVVAELGARGRGHIRRLLPAVSPDIGVVTAVAAAHLERFGDIGTVAEAKSELVEGLGGDGTAVLNAEDPRVAAMAERTNARVLTYGMHDGGPAGAGDSQVTGHSLVLDDLGRPSFVADTPWGSVAVRLRVAGAHQAHNALAALTVAGVVGVPVEDAASALGEADVASWRGEVARTAGVVVLNDAYNANPRSMLGALDTLARIRHEGRSWAVLGEMAEMGAAAEAEHDRVGRECARRGIDRLVVVGEAARGIRIGAGLEGFPDGRVIAVADADAALDLLRAEVRPGDAVLVKASRVAGLDRVAAGLLGHLGGEEST